MVESEIFAKSCIQVEEGTGKGEGGNKTNWLVDAGGSEDDDWKEFLKGSEDVTAAALSPMARVKKKSLVHKLDDLQSRGMFCASVGIYIWGGKVVCDKYLL